MRWLSWVMLVVILGSVLPSLAGENTKPHYQRWKVDNGLLVGWYVSSKQKTDAQIEIFDDSERSIAKVRVLQLVPGATSVVIDDVTARRGQMIAVGATYVRRQGERPVATLLIFDFSGKLLSAFVLTPSHEIRFIELDTNLNIWTVTMGSDGKNPSSVSMVVEYDAKGNVLRELLPRAMFPLHAEVISEGPDVGSASSGYDSGVFWFWLPGSTDLVAVRTEDGTASVRKTGLPTGSQVVPMRIVRDLSGEVVGQFQERQSDGNFHWIYDSWSPAGSVWSPFDPSECPAHLLTGLDQGELIFLRPHGDGFCNCPSPF